jgi:hypothetical protein
MRFFESKQEWLKAIQRPFLIIIVTGIRKIMLENDLYEHSAE